MNDHARQLGAYALLQHTHVALPHGAAPPLAGAVAATDTTAAAAAEIRTLVLGGAAASGGGGGGVTAGNMATLAALAHQQHLQQQQQQQGAARGTRQRFGARVRSLARRVMIRPRRDRGEYPAAAARATSEAGGFVSDGALGSSPPRGSSSSRRRRRGAGLHGLYAKDRGGHEGRDDVDDLFDDEPHIGRPRGKQEHDDEDEDGNCLGEDCWWGLPTSDEPGWPSSAEYEASKGIGGSRKSGIPRPDKSVHKNMSVNGCPMQDTQQRYPQQKPGANEPRSFAFPCQFGDWASAQGPNSVARLPKVGRCAETGARLVDLPRGAGLAPVRSVRQPEPTSSSLTGGSERSTISEGDAVRGNMPSAPVPGRPPLSPTSDVTVSRDGDVDDGAWISANESRMGAATFSAFIGMGNMAEKIAGAVVEISSEDEDSQLFVGDFSALRQSQRKASACGGSPVSAERTLPESLQQQQIHGRSVQPAASEFEGDSRAGQIALEEVATVGCGQRAKNDASVPAVIAFRNRAVKSMDSYAIASVAVGFPVEGMPAAGFPPAVLIDNDDSSAASGDSFKGTAALRSGRVLSDISGVAMAQDDFISFLFDDTSAFGPGRGARPLGTGPLMSAGTAGDVVVDGPASLRDARTMFAPARAGTDPRRSGPATRRASERAEKRDREEPRFSAPMRRALARVKVMSHLT